MIRNGRVRKGKGAKEAEKEAAVKFVGGGAGKAYQVFAEENSVLGIKSSAAEPMRRIFRLVHLP